MASKEGEWKSCDISAIAIVSQQRCMDVTRGLCITCGTANFYKILDGRGCSSAPSLTIVYEIPASVPVPNKSSTALGGAIQTAIQTNEAGARHVIAYKIDSTVLSSADLGTGAQHSYTVPTSAGTHFPNSLTGTLSVEVTTTVNGEKRGLISTEVELTLPADAAPPAVAPSARADRRWSRPTCRGSPPLHST